MSFVDVLTVVIVFIVTDQVTRRLRIFYRRNWPAYKKKRDADKKYKEAFETVLRILYPEHESEMRVITYGADLRRAVATLQMQSQNKSIAEYRRNEVASMQNAINKDLKVRATKLLDAQGLQKHYREVVEKAIKTQDLFTAEEIETHYQRRKDADFRVEVMKEVFWRHHDAAALLGFKTYPDVWAHRALKV